MHKLFLSASLSVMLAFSGVQAGDVEAPSESAMAFVGQCSDDHLSGMLSRLGGRSKVFVGLAQVHGEIVGRVLDLAVEDAVRRYGPEWQANMAMAWEPLLTEAELDSLRIDGAQSPHTEKYLGLRAQAGQSMQSSSQELFQKILTEVVGQTQTALESTKE